MEDHLQTIRLVQFITNDGHRAVGARKEEHEELRIVEGARRVLDLALEAANAQHSLIDLVTSRLGDQQADLDQLLADQQILPPIDHPDPAHCYVTGTGLTHLGSAKSRDEMHRSNEEKSKEERGDEEKPDEDIVDQGATDTSRMFRLGLEGGKPAPGEVGVQPEWFYKGNGTCLVAPEQPISCPSFGLDVGEEPELVGLYAIASNGTPWRIGFALGNELSDHVTERKNYLYLAHSKLRRCAFGPELLVGALAEDIRGTSRILRNSQVVWEAPFLTGEANMSHTIANLEYHHFKYDNFRQPGDLHCHFMGTATMSFADGFQTQNGDTFEMSCPQFGKPLRNTIALATEQDIQINPL